MRPNCRPATPAGLANRSTIEQTRRPPILERWRSSPRHPETNPVRAPTTAPRSQQVTRADSASRPSMGTNRVACAGRAKSTRRKRNRSNPRHARTHGRPASVIRVGGCLWPPCHFRRRRSTSSVRARACAVPEPNQRRRLLTRSNRFFF